MTVASILRGKGTYVATVRPDATLVTVVSDLRLKRIGALVVSENGETILGLISERDVVSGLATHGAKLLELPAFRVMSPVVVTSTPAASIRSVMGQMTLHRARHIPVVECGKLCGLVSVGDVVKHRVDELELETNVLRDTLIMRGWSVTR